MKFAFEIKTKPVTQAAIIIAIVAFSSVLLALNAIYLGDFGSQSAGYLLSDKNISIAARSISM